MKNSKVTFPLSRKIAVMVIAIAIILSTVLIAAFTEHYRQEMIEDFERMAMDVAAIAATQLNPDKFQTYLDTGVKDEEFEKAFEQLSKFRESARSPAAPARSRRRSGICCRSRRFWRSRRRSREAAAARRV